MKTYNPKLERLKQRGQAVQTLMIMAMLIFLIQLWLLTIALEEYMAVGHGLALPTFGASVFCFTVDIWLLRYLYDVDRKGDKNE